MDWVTIIILGLVLPLIGSLIGAFMVGRKYMRMKENPYEFGLEGEGQVRKNFGRFMVFQNQFGTGPIYGLLVIFLFWMSIRDLEAPDETLSKLGVVLALAVGAPAFFSNISRGLISREGIESVVRQPKNFGKATVHSVVVETPMIYGLLVAVLLLNFSGILRGEFVFSNEQVDELFNPIIVFSCLSSGVLLSGLLLSRVKEPFSFPNFPKGIQMNIIGTILPVIGLMYVINKFVEIGLFTAG